jgi:hypothetical protein
MGRNVGLDPSSVDEERDRDKVIDIGTVDFPSETP